jgi:hypothetical protein
MLTRQVALIRSTASRRHAGLIADGMVCPADPAHNSRRPSPRKTQKMLRSKPQRAAVFGVDIGKNIFHVVGADAAGAVVQKAKFRRDTLLRFFEAAEGGVVAMEACPGSQWLARKLVQLGHIVRTFPHSS